MQQQQKKKFHLLTWGLLTLKQQKFVLGLGEKSIYIYIPLSSGHRNCIISNVGKIKQQIFKVAVERTSKWACKRCIYMQAQSNAKRTLFFKWRIKLMIWMSLHTIWYITLIVRWPASLLVGNHSLETRHKAELRLLLKKHAHAHWTMSQTLLDVTRLAADIVTLAEDSLCKTTSKRLHQFYPSVLCLLLYVMWVH